MCPKDQFEADFLDSSNSNLTLKEFQNGVTEEFKNFIKKEAPPLSNNNHSINVLTASLSSQHLSEREIPVSPIV